MKFFELSLHFVFSKLQINFRKFMRREDLNSRIYHEINWLSNHNSCSCISNILKIFLATMYAFDSSKLHHCLWIFNFAKLLSRHIILLCTVWGSKIDPDPFYIHKRDQFRIPILYLDFFFH